MSGNMDQKPQSPFNKSLNSLQPSPRRYNSVGPGDDLVITKPPRRETAIMPPSNVVPESTHTVPSSVGSMMSLTSRVKRPTKRRSNAVYGRQIKNDLSPKKQKVTASERPTAKKKMDVYVYELGEKESDLLHLGEDNDEMENIMKEFDVDEMEQKSHDLQDALETFMRERGREKEKEKERGREKDTGQSRHILEQLKNDTLLDMKTCDKTSKTIDSFHKKNSQQGQRLGNLSLQSLINNKDKSDEVKRKYASGKKYIKQDLIQKVDHIRTIVEKYRPLVIDILEGQIGSYFYNEAKRLQQASPLMTIRGEDISNLPKERYYGYIGAVRGFHIGKAIERDSTLRNLIKEKAKFSKVINFWGIDNFTQYVLAPEVIAHIVLEQGKLEDLDAAYDEMEETNDYGIFVTNTVDIEGKDRIDTPVGEENIEFIVSEEEDKHGTDLQEVDHSIRDRESSREKEDSDIEENSKDLIDDIFG